MKGSIAEAFRFLPYKTGCWSVTEYVPDCHNLWSAIALNQSFSCVTLRDTAFFCTKNKEEEMTCFQ